jgi:hypothetical protein
MELEEAFYLADVDGAYEETRLLAATVRKLQVQLAQCSSERSASAALAVKSEDAAGVLRGEVRDLTRGIKHIYQHLQFNIPSGEITQPGNSCQEIHPFLRTVVGDT